MIDNYRQASYGYDQRVEAFVDSLRAGQPTSVSSADGRAQLVIGAAKWRSIREQRPVSIAEFDVGRPQ
jgi:predicted dehydrogenase